MSKRIPSLRRHKPSAQGVVTLNGHDHYLGKWLASLKQPPPEVKESYDRLIAEWLANGRALSSEQTEQISITIDELILAFWERHALLHYRHPDGKLTSEIKDYRLSLRVLRQLYGTSPMTNFGPLKLKAVRQAMIEANLSRKVINQRIGRIVRMFKWAVSEELVSESVWRALTTVRGLQKGRTQARETEPILPVSDEVVNATLPFLLPPVRAMVQLQRLTGMRPGEVCQMRACDLDTSESVWLYQPESHKTQHRGKQRIIPLGPKAQTIVKPFLNRELNAFLFSPKDAVKERCTLLRKRRKSKVQPSQQSRKKKKPKRAPRERYQTEGYCRAIARACDRAFPPPKSLAQRDEETKQAWLARLTPQETESLKRWQKEHRWHPNQLRHTYATELRKDFGLEAAQVALGHATADVTQVYAERDLSLAIQVARQIG